MLVERLFRQEIQQLEVQPVAAQAVSTSTSLMKVVEWDGMSQDINQVLATTFEAEDYLDCIKNLQTWNIDPQSYINNLDKVSS